MKLEELNIEYDKLQKKYGAKNLDSIYNGGCRNNPDICFVFMNPTSKNVASVKNWQGLKAPFLGTKKVWNLFYTLGLLDENIYEQIKSYKPQDWTYKFANMVCENIAKHKVFITNLGKCTQIDARPLPDATLKKYLNLLKREWQIINPKVIILFGNQVSSIVLKQKISVSMVRKQKFERIINKEKYVFYAVYYPIGNGTFNIDKAIEDIKWIQNNILTKGKANESYNY